MIVHDDIETIENFQVSDQKRRARRQATRKPSVRTSAGEVQDLPSAVEELLKDDREGVTVYQVLLGVLFSFSLLNPRMADESFQVLMSLSQETMQRLDEQAIVFLEDTFHALHPDLNHLFLPFIAGVPNFMKDPAHVYLDLESIVQITEDAVRNSLTPSMTSNDVKDRLQPVHWLKRKLRKLRRETL